MKIWDILTIAFMNLWRRKLRAFLTVLGMAIGTTSIVVMVSLGIGMQETNRQMFENWGDLSTLTVNNYRWVETGRGMMSGEEVKLDEKSVQAIKKISGVKAVMPQVQTWCMVTSGQYASDLSILGVDMEVAEEFGFKLEEGGRMPQNVGGSKIEVVFGNYVLQNFYNPRTGKQAFDYKTGTNKISLEKSRFQMTFDYNNIYDYEDYGGETRPKGKMYKLNPVGVQAEEGNNSSYYSLMDINTLKKLAKDNKDFINLDFDNYNSVLVKCTSSSEVTTVQKAIEDMGYGVDSLQSSLEIQQQSARQTQSLLGAIGGVALLVAAIGIMNTMMMSIYERTREIDIIKVLGCRMKNISTMFLSEAAYIGFFGGLVGLGLSYLLGFLMNTFMFASENGMSMGMASMKSVIPIWLALGGVLFSVAVAFVSGMYPAVKAMRLSALAAIRSE